MCPTTPLGLAANGGDWLPNAEVRRLLETYRPELIGRDDITTPGERREIALLLLLEERFSGPVAVAA
jgi:hypothetical protein